MSFVPRTLSNGSPCCSVAPLCDACLTHHMTQYLEEHGAFAEAEAAVLKAAGAHRELAVTAAAGFAPPDPYAAGIAAMSAASATPESTFEERWKAERLEALNAEHARLDALVAAHPSPRLTTAEAESLAPPDPWNAGIKALRERDARAATAKETARRGAVAG
jgi:hypothetical protein